MTDDKVKEIELALESLSDEQFGIMADAFLRVKLKKDKLILLSQMEARVILAHLPNGDPVAGKIKKRLEEL